MASAATSPGATIYAATDELRTDVLAEVLKAELEAYEETTEPGAYNILSNSTPEAITDNFMTLITEYTAITHQYGNLTDLSLIHI